MKYMNDKMHRLTFVQVFPMSGLIGESQIHISFSIYCDVIHVHSGKLHGMLLRERE